jgi:hypothetical protein
VGFGKNPWLLCRFEQTNLAAQLPHVVDSLAEQLLAWEAMMPQGSVFLNPGCTFKNGLQVHDGIGAETVEERFAKETAHMSQYMLA